MKRRGVYAIRNTQNGRLYIGAAGNLSKRWGEHRWNLRNGRHHNPRLQQDWVEYGCDAFVFEIVEEVPNEVWLCVQEGAHIRRLQPYYNGPGRAEFRMGGGSYMPWMLEYARQLGDGNRAAGLRRIVAEHAADRGYEPK